MLTFAGYIKFVNFYVLCFYRSSKMVGLFWFWPTVKRQLFSLNLDNDKSPTPSPEDPPRALHVVCHSFSKVQKNDFNLTPYPFPFFNAYFKTPLCIFC